MKSKFLHFVVAIMCLMLILVCASCKDDSSNDTNSNTDANINTDINIDTTTDTSTDTNIDTSTDTEADTGTNTDSSRDTDTNIDNDNTSNAWQSNASTKVIEQVEALLESKHKLEYNEDGSFRVMILADVHMNVDGAQDAVLAVKSRVQMLVDKINPNLIILTGDNTINSSSEEKLRKNIDAIVSYIEEKQIPWCHVYGNHDHESALSNSVQQAIYESYEYCISKDVEELSGTGTYVHGVYNKDGSLGSLVWLIDSGAYATGGGYDYIKPNQISWYKQTSLLIKEYNNGTAVKGMMAFHIPLIENRVAEENKNDTTIVYEYSGSLNEPMCPSNTDTNLLETIFELGDVKLIVTGHDHKNDYMYNYKGVKLTSSPNISDLTYYDTAFQGSRVIDLDAAKMDNVPTYVEYLIERLNPDDFESIEKDTVIEDFEGNYAAPIISGWANEGLKGTVTIEKAEGMGVGSSDALSVSRDDVSNFEFVIDISSVGKVGSNKYIVLWMDFSNVDFRKACVGLASAEGYENPYRTDDNDGTNPKFYYLADATSEWVEFSHGGDGCFGIDQSSGVNGKKGYFAFAIEDLRQGSKSMNENTLVSGFYFYGSLWQGGAYLNKPFYIDNVMLCQDYTQAKLLTE